MHTRAILVLVFIGAASLLKAQTCTFPGQTPASAVLVCGTQTFIIGTPTMCGQTDVPVPCPGGFDYQNNNPNFFRMNCFVSGTLGFTLVPDDNTADYNWQLFDITNRNPEAIFTDASLFVACNWSSEPGETGASADGTELSICAGAGQPLFSKMPDIQAGKTYMLMVSNYTGRPGTYELTFSGGSAIITDDVEPELAVARATCNGDRVVVRMNKKMKCESLAPNGTDFSISGGVTISSAVAGDCTPVLGSDSIVLFLSQSLSPDNYTVTINTGTDGNTMTDVCNRAIPAGESIPLIVQAPQPTPLDSVFRPGCAPSQIELVFKNPIQCNSIAPNGSDFQVSGPQAVNVNAAGIGCDPNTATIRIIRLQLAEPIVTGGTYVVRLVAGTDGNTIIDECNFSTPANSTVSFTVKDTVSARFSYNSTSACSLDTISFMHAGGNGIDSWQWNFGNVMASSLANPLIVFTGTGQQTVSLTVSNGFCTDTYSQSIVLNQQLKAAFEAPDIACPGDPVPFVNNSEGTIDFWLWNFGNGTFSNEKTPASFTFPAGQTERFYTVMLIAGSNAANCRDTARKTIRVPGNCFIAVPTAFTPNNDGLNDYLYPLNPYKAIDLDFKVFNRFGQLVFTTKKALQKWDGRVNGVMQNAGLYAWTLSFTHSETGKRIFMKGTSMLIR